MLMSSAIVSSPTCVITVSTIEVVNSDSFYLPKVNKWTKNETEVDELKATISSLAKSNIIPFTKEQERIFTESKLIENKTIKYLGSAGYGIIVALGMVGGLAGVRIAKMTGYEDESIANDLIPFTISTLVGVGLGVASMLFTGTFPDQKSDAADAKERECLELEKQFNEAAYRLISLFWSKKRGKHEEAKKLAEEIKVNLPNIKTKLSIAIGVESEDERITHVLSTAVDYIVSNANCKVLISSLDQLIKLEQLKKSSKKPPCLVV